MLQEMAFEASQKYKEGKFIIEKARLMKVSYFRQSVKLIGPSNVP